MVGNSQSGLHAEIEPDTTVGDRRKRPDFRIRRYDNPWLYVEVARPDTADAQKALESKRQLFSSVLSILRRFALQIYLRREPSDDEIKQVVARAMDLCARDQEMTEEMGTLGVLLLNQAQPGNFVPINPLAKPVSPILGGGVGHSWGR